MRDGELIQIATPEEMSANPENEYVKQFIDSADKTQVISVGNVMITPNSIIRLKDNPSYAIAQMRNNGVSSAYVVAEKMRLQGVVTIDDSIRANRDGLSISDILIRNINTTTPDTLLHDILPIAAETRFPIAVINEDGSLKGIISKAHVLSSMI